jgi:hypothetical protein
MNVNVEITQTWRSRGGRGDAGITPGVRGGAGGGPSDDSRVTGMVKLPER